MVAKAGKEKLILKEKGKAKTKTRIRTLTLPALFCFSSLRRFA